MYGEELEEYWFQNRKGSITIDQFRQINLINVKEKIFFLWYPRTKIDSLFETK